ncbi:MAG TPA: tetratricopeptide repeat protein, partial [Pyrinomonadaceae bacterium]|nr:tetratricopeptide repeat protein [Pyrinomonadaceae bacterium]
MKTATKAALLILVSALACAPARAQEQAAAWQVTRYDLTATLPSGTERALAGRARIEARNVGGTGRTFTVHVNPDMEVRSATVNDVAARFTQRTNERTRLKSAQLTLPAPVASGGAVNVVVEYGLAVGNNTGLAALTPEGSQFLPLSHWYPSPNTQFSPRGADTAPFRLTVNGASGETVVSAGQSQQGSTFELPINGQPFFLTGRWEAVEGGAEARGVSAWLWAGASAEERKRAEALVALAASARAFYSTILGPAPDVPVRLVAVRRGSGFDMGGVLLLDASVFRRQKTDAETAMNVGEAVARLWLGGSTGLQGESAGVIREGLSRYLATLFLEKQFGPAVADEQRMRMALAYAPVARRDGPLSQLTPLSADYSTAVSNKGALVWRLVAAAMGREQFAAALRAALEAHRGPQRLTLSALRAALGEGSNEALRRVTTSVFDQPTDTDLLVGLPQQRAGEWVAALRNTGSIDTDVTVAGYTDTGQRLNAQVRVPAKDFADARFKTTAKVVRVEVDPEKLYPQVDYSNDIAPRGPSTEETLGRIPALFAQQQYAQVEEAARALLRQEAGMQEARTWLARALLERNQLDAAEKEFRAALDHPLPTRQTLAWASLGLGEIAARRGQGAEAARLFEAAARAEGDYASTLAARLARVRANPPAPDESARAFVA